MFLGGWRVRCIVVFWFGSAANQFVICYLDRKSRGSWIRDWHWCMHWQEGGQRNEARFWWSSWSQSQGPGLTRPNLGARRVTRNKKGAVTLQLLLSATKSWKFILFRTKSNIIAHWSRFEANEWTGAYIISITFADLQRPIRTVCLAPEVKLLFVCGLVTTISTYQSVN